MKEDEVDQDLYEGATGALIWVVVIIEIILMGSLAIISIMSLRVTACKKRRKTASFIIKLLILVLLVSISGVVNAIHEAPWWKNSRYFGTVWSIVVI